MFITPISLGYENKYNTLKYIEMLLGVTA